MADNPNSEYFGSPPIPKMTASDIAHLKRLLALFGTSPDVMTSALPSTGAGEAELLNRKARWMSAARLQRRALFPPALFAEHAWDALLHLYIAQDRQRMSFGMLVKAIGAPGTTLLRWLDYLTETGLIRSTQSPTDSRVRFIDLTGKGLATMTAYLQSLPPMPS